MTSKHPKKSLHTVLKVCGFSGSGKTTLIEALIDRLKVDFHVAYRKHDAHGLDLDVAGKDTDRAFRAGARSISINDSHQSVLRAHSDLALNRLHDFQSRNADITIGEGWKFEPGPKIVLVDEAQQILQERSRLQDVLAYVGTTESIAVDAPYFHRDNIADIHAFIQDWLSKVRPVALLNGLVLTGGLSTRMKSDKSLLRYHSKPQAAVCFDLLTEVCDQTYLSCRDQQFAGTELASFPQITDRFLGFGPMGGILTALEHNSKTAWLVVACDLPLLGSESLQHLVNSRDRRSMATYFVDHESQLPEPLCAIYEPPSRSVFLDYLQMGIHCPRKILINEGGNALAPFDQRALTNANSQDEFNEAKSIIQAGMSV